MSANHIHEHDGHMHDHAPRDTAHNHTHVHVQDDSSIILGADGTLDYSASNKHHFNHVAHTYDSRPHVTELAHKIAGAFLKEYPFNEEETEVMEYACGTGLVSRELAPHAKRILGVDISEGMVEQFNLRVYNQGIERDEMHAVCVELTGKDDNELGGWKFDVIVCSMAYHHFPSTEETSRLLLSFLKPGGTLLIADLIKKDDSPEDVVHGPSSSGQNVVVHKGGFTEDQIREMLEKAGFIDMSWRPAVRAKAWSADKELEVFVAKGRKKSDY